MKLEYIGPHDAVEIELPDGRILGPVERGEAIEIPSVKVHTGLDGDDQETHRDLVDTLLEQSSNWRQAAPPAARKTADKAEKE